MDLILPSVFSRFYREIERSPVHSPKKAGLTKNSCV
jgi:hypothetical protein